MFTATGTEWAGVPGQATSTFGGRCSVPSDYVITATFEGDATHAGHMTGTASHCSQLIWSPQGPHGRHLQRWPGRPDQRERQHDRLPVRQRHAGFDPDSGLLWFRDEWTFIEGTGLFSGVTGSSIEGGSFASFEAFLAGAPVPMWMQGTITYRPEPQVACRAAPGDNARPWAAALLRASAR